MLLRIVETDEYGSRVYVEDRVNGTVPVSSLEDDECWSIRDPPAGVLFLGLGHRKVFNGTPYIVSSKALSFLPNPDDGFGAVVVMSFIHPSTKVEYYILTSDRKPYWMNCGGRGEAGETPKETVVREVTQQLSVDLSTNHLDLVDEVQMEYHTVLVDTYWTGTMFVFYTFVAFSQVEHLFRTPIDPSLDYLVFEGGEGGEGGKRILLVRGDCLDTVPSQISGKTFSGYHRKVLDDIERGASFVL